MERVVSLERRPAQPAVKSTPPVKGGGVGTCLGLVWLGSGQACGKNVPLGGQCRCFVSFSARCWPAITTTRRPRRYAQGDGVLLYGENTLQTLSPAPIPKALIVLTAQASTVSTLSLKGITLKTSPLKQRRLLLILPHCDQVMCYDGTTWTNEWSATLPVCYSSAV